MKRQRQAPSGTYNKGIKLREWREAANLTQGDVCAKVGITQATLSRYELGQIRASADFIKRVAEIYHVDASDVLSAHPDNEVNLNEAIALLKQAKPEQREIALRAVRAILYKD